MWHEASNEVYDYITKFYQVRMKLLKEQFNASPPPPVEPDTFDVILRLNATVEFLYSIHPYRSMPASIWSQICVQYAKNRDKVLERILDAHVYVHIVYNPQ